MLKTILMVTIMAPDLLQVKQAYRDELDYRVVRRGSFSSALAASMHLRVRLSLIRLLSYGRPHGSQPRPVRHSLITS